MRLGKEGKGNEVYLEIALDRNWLLQKKLVTTSTLTKAIVPGLPFENAGGFPLQIDTDYSGRKRNNANPSPGSFEILQSGKQVFKVFSSTRVLLRWLWKSRDPANT